MIYTPRYSDWIHKRDVDLESLPEHLLSLISTFQSAHDAWENATEDEQAKYIKVLRSTDAYISAVLFSHLGNNPKSNSEDDKLKALLSKAADLDF